MKRLCVIAIRLYSYEEQTRHTAVVLLLLYTRICSCDALKLLKFLLAYLFLTMHCTYVISSLRAPHELLTVKRIMCVCA